MICQKAMSKGTELIKLGEIVEVFSIPPHPRGISLEGKLVVLKPLKASDYSKELSGLTVNLLVNNISKSTEFITNVIEAKIIYEDIDKINTVTHSKKIIKARC